MLDLRDAVEIWLDICSKRLDEDIFINKNYPYRVIYVTLLSQGRLFHNPPKVPYRMVLNLEVDPAVKGIYLYVSHIVGNVFDGGDSFTHPVVKYEVSQPYYQNNTLCYNTPEFLCRYPDLESVFIRKFEGNYAE